jgi:hypothetical protein
MQNFPDNRDEKSLTAEELKIAEENAKKSKNGMTLSINI